MMFRWRAMQARPFVTATHTLPRVLPVFVIAAMCGCGGDVTKPIQTTKIARIVIDGGPRAVERGSVVPFTATATDSVGKTVPVPFVWSSSVDSVGVFDRDGKLTAKVPGNTIVTASALGISSGGVQVVVVWLGAAKVAPFQFNPPLAITPSASPVDSVRVLVTTLSNGPAVGANVAFKVTGGGGTVTPAVVTVGPAGTAAAKWVLGSTAGKNTVTATVVGADSSTLLYWVTDNPSTFTAKTYAALAIVQGDGQAGAVLAPLPVTPSVRLVDTAGKPRAGIPVTFAASANGRVANAVVSTNVDGVATPGVWTLGDVAGDQQLVVTVEAAKIALHAAASGTTVRFSAPQVATTQAATCALTSDQFISCLGQPPQIGTGDTAVKSLPTLTKGGVQLTAMAGASSGSHFCGTSADLSIYCWGGGALVDTAGVLNNTAAPTRLPSNTAWIQVSPGGQHNCALANDRSAYCWGIDASGQLGDNGTANHFSPQPVSGGFKFTAISSGASHSCGVTVDAAAFCWGLNANGQIGDGTTALRRTPTAVSGSFKWRSIGAGIAWSCGLIDTGAAYCWGAGTGRAIPGNYPTAPTFSSLSVGGAHACALTSDGTAYCWGDNSSGQLGDSTTTSRDAPTAVATLLRFASISAGFQHSCAVTNDGFVACWGRNTVGELGVSAPFLQLTPRFLVTGVQP